MVGSAAMHFHAIIFLQCQCSRSTKWTVDADQLDSTSEEEPSASVELSAWHFFSAWITRIIWIFDEYSTWNHFLLLLLFLFSFLSFRFMNIWWKYLNIYWAVRYFRSTFSNICHDIDIFIQWRWEREKPIAHTNTVSGKFRKNDFFFDKY